MSIYGWGSLYTDGPSPSKLQEITVNIVSDRTCQAAFDAYDPRRWTITSNMVCAGGVGGEDSCQVENTHQTQSILYIQTFRVIVVDLSLCLSTTNMSWQELSAGAILMNVHW